jgi:hypothetical protein
MGIFIMPVCCGGHHLLADSIVLRLFGFFAGLDVPRFIAYQTAAMVWIAPAAGNMNLPSIPS